MSLFESTTSANPQLRRRLAWPRACFDNLCVLCVYAIGVSDKRTEPEAEFKAEAVVSKGADIISEVTYEKRE